MNIMTGRCGEQMFGQCPYCHGSLTIGHKCPGQEVAEEAVRSMMDESNKPPKLAQMIRLWIAATGYEQADVAKAIGCSTSTLSRFLNGQNMPDGRTTARMLSWLIEA